MALARRSVNDFVELVMRDEQTGAPLVQAPIHEEWHRLANEHRRLVLFSHPEAGKTQQLAIGRVLWILGRNPGARLAVISRTTGLAEKIVTAAGRYIESDPLTRRVFPELLPDKRMPWTRHQLYVRRPFASKDASLQAFGVGSEGLQGSRLDGVVLDDVVDYESSRTKHRRDEVFNWFESITDQRLTAEAFLIAIGNAFHPDDLLHRLAKRPGYVCRRYPVVDAEGRSTWPDKWPAARIEEKRAGTSPLVFAQQFLCDARDDETAAFRREWLDACVERGATEEPARWKETSLEQRGGCVTLTGVDLAISKRDSADLTSLFTALVYPNGDRRVVNVEAGRMSFPETVERVKAVHARYGGTVVVESNAYQAALVQQLQASTSIPVRGFMTGTQVSHPQLGIAGMAAEFANRKWILPSKGGLHPEVRAWVDEMLYYDPAAHVGDRLMSSWIALQGLRFTGGHRIDTRFVGLR